MPAIASRIFAILAALAFAGTAHAQNATRVSPADAVAGTHDATYLDLARQLVPDIALDSDGLYGGHKVIDVRHIGGADWKSDPPETITILEAAALPIKSDGQDRLLLLFGLEPPADAGGIGPAVLALYSLGNSPKLIDAADVSYDDDTSFFDPGLLSLGDGKDAVLTMSTHSNAGESYQTTALILLRKDRLELVDTVATLAHFLGCGYMSDEEPAFHAGKGDGRAWPDIVATVTQTIELNGQCNEQGRRPPKAGTRVVTVTYRWDETASKYVADSDAFDKLAEEDGDRL
jgi:hypothetical protein